MAIRDIFVGNEPASVPEVGMEDFKSYTPQEVASAIGASSVRSVAEMPEGSSDGDLADLNAKMNDLWGK